MRYGHKRYNIRYESDKIVCRSNEHSYCNASTLKSAIAIANRIKKELADENARNIRVYDVDAGDCNEPAPVVYEVK